MWSVWEQAGLFLITTNASTRADGRLVMGAGIARQARDRFPGLDARLGDVVACLAQDKVAFSHRGREYHFWSPGYHTLVSPDWPQARPGLFQVKQRFCDPASLDLIERSVGMLCWWCQQHPEAQVHLNFPGIGNGRLAQDDVLPLIGELPDSVHVWQYRSLSLSTSTRVVHCKREPCDVHVGRPGKWGNPFRIGPDGTRQEVVAKYRAWVVQQPELMAALPELAGKTLGCWCKPEACHGDVLVKLVEQLGERG
jgi:hypothetical protein